jgi:lipoprotein-anchoring transpeptidase ErfK/SrfK
LAIELDLLAIFSGQGGADGSAWRLVNQDGAARDKEKGLVSEQAFRSARSTFGPPHVGREEWLFGVRPMMRMRSLLFALAVALLPAAQTPAQARESVLSGYEAGTIVVKTSARKLYLVLENGQTVTYPVGVGKTGRTWTGTGYITGKFLAPAWSPPADVRREKPGLPDVIAGGSLENPMGAAAMTLSVDQYAIHGTNRPDSIGGFVSFGCIRMRNADVLDLYRRVKVGTPVVVLR